MGLKERECGLDLPCSVQGQLVGSFEGFNDPSLTMKGGEFLD
jgi:hypothetical protein